jgi:hypothetical protein
MVRQAKKWLFFTEADFTNAGPSFSYGLSNINISTTTAGIASAVYANLMENAALNYEEYRIRRVTVFAQPGNGYTNDRRIKSSVFARVDVNSQPTAATINNLNSVICAESTVNRTFTERSNIKLVDYQPICYSSGGSGASSRPILGNAMQWYNIDERSAHIWRGATICPLITETGLQPGTLSQTIWVDVEVEFRSRRPDVTNFASLSREDNIPPAGSFVV